MKSTAFSRFFMLTAGIVAAMVMLLSVSLYQSKAETSKSTPKTEQSSSDYSIVNAPTDALPGSGTVQVEVKTLPLLETFLPIEKVQESIYLPLRVTVKYFKVLLKTVISPNAP